MKKISFLIITLFLFVGCNSEKKITSLQVEGLNGKVKSIFSYCYEAESRFGKIEKGKIIRSYDRPYWSDIVPACKTEFNAEGYICKKTFFSENGETTHVMVCEFEDGLISRYCTYGYDGEIMFSSINHYNNGKLTAHESFSAYDKSNNISHRYEINDGKIVTDSAFVGDELKSITRIMENLSIEEDVDGNEKSRFIHEKDEYERPLKLESIHHGDSNFKDYEMLFTYNERGWLTRLQRNEKSETNEITFEYIEFDSKDNWTSRAIYLNGELKAVEERTFEYF